MTKCK